MLLWEINYLVTWEGRGVAQVEECSTLVLMVMGSNPGERRD